jgi:ABC-type transport system substrate-binding protein/DNA-binding SARP family transcriptional activator
MDLYLLGPIEARRSGRPIPLGARQERAVLAMLGLHAGRTVSADRLSEGLWGERAPPSAHKLVQHYVSHLRRTLNSTGAEIVTRGRGYELRLPDGEVDVVRFEALVDAGRPREALALWRGDPLADVADAPFAAEEVRRLDELRLRAAESAIDADLAAGRHADLIGELQTLVAEHPLSERLHAQRMLALYRSGRQAEALEAYRDARAVLVDEVGVEPGAELRGLHDRILAQDPELHLVTEPAARPPPARAPTRRVVVPALLLAALLLVAGLIAFGITRVTGPDHLDGIDENAVGLIDPDRGAITDQRSVGRGAAAVIGGGDSIWVANSLDGTVSRIHPDRPEVGTIQVGGAPAGLAFGAGSLWVADGEGRKVAQVDPGANTVLDRIDVGNAPRALAFAAGSLWVASGVDSRIGRVDIGRRRVTDPVAVDPNPTAMAAGYGSLWVASEEAGTVTRVDPRSATASPPIDVGNGPSAVAVGEGGVWVVNRHDGTVSRIDPATNAVSWVRPVGGDPTAIAAGAGAVWVARGEARAVARLDPRAQRVIESIETGSSPAAIAVVDDTVWTAAVASQAAHRGGTLRTIIPADPAAVSVDWLSKAGYDWTTYHLASLAYDGLVAYRRVGGVAGATIVGGLATSAPEPSADGRTYVFTLRPGLRFSDGSAVRPEDFRASMERVLRLGERVPAFFSGIVGARRCAARPSPCDLSAGIDVDAGARTITIHLVRRDGDFLHKLTTPFAFVVPAGTTTATGDAVPPGTGPYRIASWDRHRGGVLVRNPSFRSWAPQARPSGFADRIEVAVRPVRHLRAQIAKVQAGKADLVVIAHPFGSFVAPGRLRSLSSRAPGRLSTFPTTTTEWMFLNVERPPFDDVRVRRALNYATDRAHVEALAGGRAVAVSTCQILAHAFPGHEPYCPYRAAPDMQRLRAQIAESGHAGERVVVRAPSGQPVGRYFTALLDDLGFRASLRVVSSEDYFDRVLNLRSRAQIGFEGWSADYLSPSSMLVPNFTCATEAERAAENASHSCDRRLAALVDRALGARGAAATSRWAAADRYVVDHAYAVPLTNHRAAVLVSKRVGNVQNHLQWFTLLDQLWVR